MSKRTAIILACLLLPGGLIIGPSVIAVRIFRRIIGKRKLRSAINQFRQENAIRVQKEGRA